MILLLFCLFVARIALGGINYVRFSKELSWASPWIMHAQHFAVPSTFSGRFTAL